MKVTLRIYTHRRRLNLGMLFDLMPSIVGVTVFILIWELWITVEA